MKKLVRTAFLIITVTALLCMSSAAVFAASVNGKDCSVKFVNDYRGNYIIALNGLTRTVYSFTDTGTGDFADEDADQLIINDGTAESKGRHFEVVESDIGILDYDYSDCPCYQCCPGYEYLDLDMRMWYHDGIHFCLQNGYMCGSGDDYFHPTDYAIRADFFSSLYAVAGCPQTWIGCPYGDVAEGSYYMQPAIWAYETGVDGGIGGVFAPRGYITREAAAVLIYRFALINGHVTGEEPVDSIAQFEDADKFSPELAVASAWCVDMGIMSGSGDGFFRPDEYITRAELAAVILKYCSIK